MKKTKVLLAIITLLILSCEDSNDDSVQIEAKSNLLFEKLTRFDSILQGPWFGMTNSLSENSLYISSRNSYELNNGSEISNREHIVKINLDNEEITEKYHYRSDFATKRLLIKDNKLISIGGQYVNTYELDLSSDPITENHKRLLSRFKVAKENDQIYIVGGDFDPSPPDESDKIYRWNPETPDQFIEFATLPEPLYGASAVIADNNLYVFGGSKTNRLKIPSKMMYIVPLGSPNEIRKVEMDVVINETFAQKLNEKIILISGENKDGQTVITKFDTTTEVFEIIEHNLDEINPNYRIREMSLVENKLYIIFGGMGSLSLNDVWSVLSTTLNF